MIDMVYQIICLFFKEEGEKDSHKTEKNKSQRKIKSVRCMDRGVEKRQQGGGEESRTGEMGK